MIAAPQQGQKAWVVNSHVVSSGRGPVCIVIRDVIELFDRGIKKPHIVTARGHRGQYNVEELYATPEEALRVCRALAGDILGNAEANLAKLRQRVNAALHAAEKETE